MLFQNYNKKKNPKIYVEQLIEIETKGVVARGEGVGEMGDKNEGKCNQ